jgi:hypothetical protein
MEQTGHEEHRGSDHTTARSIARLPDGHEYFMNPSDFSSNVGSTRL